MKSETKTCQNCKNDFTIESEDFLFYEKIKVSPPTWCSQCRLCRKLIFRNESSLYHRTDNIASADSPKIISMYSEDKKLTVCDHKFWWSDKWDAYSHGKEYDFSKPFFEQMKELIAQVPWPNLMNWNAINSDYCNYTTDNKNCYLVFGGDFNEDCLYSKFNFRSQNSQDLYWVNKCNLCYECIDVEESYKVFFAKNVKGCSNCMFMFDCSNCNDCVGCVGLRNKNFCIFNKQYSKEEYKKLIEEFKLNTRTGINQFSQKFYNFKLKFPHKYANILKSINCTGDNILGSKNCINCFEIDTDGKDLKDVAFGGWGARDANSVCHFGHNAELSYDSIGVFSDSQNVKFSLFQPSSMDVSYSYNCPSSSHLFGCVGIKKGEYAILNKKYTKEAYEELVPKIIEHMYKMPYIDSIGRSHGYGEFLPIDLSPFCYNETVAQEYFPLTKEEALISGYKWKDAEKRNFSIEMESNEIPDDIKDVSDNILGKVLGCEHKGKCNEQCTEVFKIIPQELQFYKRLNLPLPNLCYRCRHHKRLKQRNPLKLWHRQCMCEKDTHGHKGRCLVEFETSYAPDRPEIVYCEKCYQKEVY